MRDTNGSTTEKCEHFVNNIKGNGGAHPKVDTKRRFHPSIDMCVQLAPEQVTKLDGACI